MRLARFSIRNYSRLEDLELAVREHVVLVGPNDVGKSSILHCLDLLLGASTAQLYSRIVPSDLRTLDEPFVVESDLVELSDTEEALFPDEITVDAGTGAKLLTVRLEASFDSLMTLAIDRSAPAGRTGRQLSRDQLAGVGWTLLGATAGARDIRDDRRSMLDQILSALDLGGEKAAFEGLVANLGSLLANSKALDGVRGDLAGQLSKALPEPVEKSDLVFTPAALVDDDVLSGVRLQITKGGAPRGLSEQSDGIRALYAIALYDLTNGGANLVAIDEPEVHLHPTSQRSLARLLRSTSNQKILATHSPDIVSAFEPESIVAVRAGGTVRQPDKGFLSDNQRRLVHWWVRDRLEPLTARRVVAVEGVSDRIVLNKAAELTGRDLDRLGVSVIETDGAGDMGAIYQLFGEEGFKVPMSMLVDRDAAKSTADKVGVAEADLNAHSVWISEKDLEEEYTGAIGAERLWEALEASGQFTRNELANCSTSGPAGTRTAEDVADFCRRKKGGYKVRAAIVVAQVLDESMVRSVTSIDDLLNEIAL